MGDDETVSMMLLLPHGLFVINSLKEVAGKETH